MSETIEQDRQLSGGAYLADVARLVLPVLAAGAMTSPRILQDYFIDTDALRKTAIPFNDELRWHRHSGDGL